MSETRRAIRAVRVDEKTLEKLRAAAKKKKCSMGQLIEELLRN